MRKKQHYIPVKLLYFIQNLIFLSISIKNTPKQEGVISPDRALTFAQPNYKEMKNRKKVKGIKQ